MSFIEIVIGLVILIIVNLFASKKDNGKIKTQKEDTSKFELKTKKNNISNSGRELTQKIIQEPIMSSSGGKTLFFILVLIIVGAFYAFFTGKIPLDLLKYLF